MHALYVKLIRCSRALEISVRLVGGRPSAFYELTSGFGLASQRSFLRKTNDNKT